MKPVLFAFSFLFAALISLAHGDIPPFAAQAEVVGDIEVSALNSARSNVVFAAGSFVRSPVAKALAKAHKRGVKVEIIFEQDSRGENPSANFLAFIGVPVFVNHAKCTNSFILIDYRTVISQPLSIARAPQQPNRDPVLDAAGTLRYAEFWQERRKQSKPFSWRLSPQQSARAYTDVPAYFRYGTVLEAGSTRR